MTGATLLSVTLVPVLCSLLIDGRNRGEGNNPVRWPLIWVYRPLLCWALRHLLTMEAAVLVFAGAVSLIPVLGRIHAVPERGRPDVMSPSDTS